MKRSKVTKNRDKSVRRFLMLLCLIEAILLGVAAQQILTLQNQQPKVVTKTKEVPNEVVRKEYQLDGELSSPGLVTKKYSISDGGGYFISIKGYGDFAVTKDQFDTVVLGDPMPDYIEQRGITDYDGQ